MNRLETTIEKTIRYSLIKFSSNLLDLFFRTFLECFAVENGSEFIHVKSLDLSCNLSSTASNGGLPAEGNEIISSNCFTLLNEYGCSSPTFLRHRIANLRLVVNAHQIAASPSRQNLKDPVQESFNISRELTWKSFLLHRLVVMSSLHSTSFTREEEMPIGNQYCSMKNLVQTQDSGKTYRVINNGTIDCKIAALGLVVIPVHPNFYKYSGMKQFSTIFHIFSDVGLN